MRKGSPRDIDDILREEGPDAARAFRDSAEVFQGRRPDDEPGTRRLNGSIDARRRRFAPVFLDDITVDDEPAYIVEGIIPGAPSFGIIPAPPKSLKSFFVTDLWLHIAIGKPYAGRQLQQGVTIYVTCEGVQGVKRRLVVMRRHHRVEGKKIPFILVPVMPNLGTGDGDRKQLINDIKAGMAEGGLPAYTPIRAICIDTLRRATPGKSENKAEDMSAFIDNCEAIAIEFSCFVGVVHHSPRSDNKRGSGTNAIEGAADVIMPVERHQDANPPRATVTIDRMKDGEEEGLSWTFEVRNDQVGVDRDGKPKYGGYVVLVDEPALKEAALSKPQERREPATVIALRAAFTEALDTAGKTIRIRDNGPAVKAVRVSDVRTEFNRRHVTGNEDPKKRANAQYRAFSRALEKTSLCRGVEDGVEWLWR
jgi:AAA domain